MLTLSKLKFWQPLQIYQQNGTTPEVLGLLLSSLLHCLITKRAQNQEKSEFLFVFRSNFSLMLSKLKLWQPPKILPAMWSYIRGVGTTTLLSASLFDNKKGSKPIKTCILINFPLIFSAYAQLTQILTATSKLLAVWTHTWGVGTSTLQSASMFDNKNGSKPRKTCIFY